MTNETESAVTANARPRSGMLEIDLYPHSYDLSAGVAESGVVDVILTDRATGRELNVTLDVASQTAVVSS